MQRGALQRLVDALIVVLVVVVLGLTGWVVTRDVQPSVSPAEETVGEPTLTADPSASASASAEPGEDPTTGAAPTSYAVIGDSVAASPSWPDLMATATGVTLAADEASRSAGYVDSGNGDPTFLAQAQALVAAGTAPDLVVVAGSRADADASGSEVQTAATEVYDLLAAELPASRVVVIGPLWPTFAVPIGDPNGARQGVKVAARDAGLTYVDPQTDPWLTEAQRDLVEANGVELTDAGDAYVAEQVQQALVGQGVLPG